jgi:hypothetical protein
LRGFDLARLPPGTLIVVAGRCSTSQYDRADKAITLVIYTSTYHPDYDLD